MELPLDADVLAARTGDRLAFGRLVARYGRLVTSISLATVKNVAVSEEVAQDVFLAAWRDLGTLRNASSFLPWLRQLTRHRALDAVRLSRGRHGRTLADEASLAAAMDPRPGAEEALLQNERASAVAAALDLLPTDAREVLTLFYREGQSIAQVARLLGLREDTVKKRLSRARADLREELDAGFAAEVASTAPAEAFSDRVMVALPLTSPPIAVVVGKGVSHLLAKWAFLVAGSATSLVMLASGLPMFGRMRQYAKGAIDERERRALRWMSVAAMANLAIFTASIPVLREEGGAHWRRLACLAAIWFGAVHMTIFFVWLPRAIARRRSAEEARDPGAGSRYARQDRVAKRVAAGACAVVAVVLVFAWMR